MAAIGKVAAVFTAQTSGLTSGVQAAANSFRKLGGDAGSLQASLSKIEGISFQSLTAAGPAAQAAAAAFQSISSRADVLRTELQSGAISAESFRDSMAALTQEASTQAQVFSAGAATTAQFATAQERFASVSSSLDAQLAAGAISAETFGRAMEAARNALSEADGTAAAARDAASELAATQQRGASITEQYASAEERYSASLAELNGLLSSGAISQETFSRAVSAAESALAESNGTAAAARASMEALTQTHRRGAAVAQQNMTAEERYASEIDDLNDLLRAGAISQETFNRASERAAQSLRNADSATKEANKGFAAMAVRLNALIGIEIAKFFASIVSTISNAVRSLVSFGSAQSEVIDQTSKLANRLGMTYGELAGLGLAGELAGVSLDQIGTAATKADVALVRAQGGSATAAAAFRNLGLNLEQLAGMSAADRFDAIASSIAALPTEAERAAAAVQIFGRTGAELLPLFNSGADAVRLAREEAERFGLALTNAQGQDVENMNDAFTRVQKAVEGIVQQVVAYLSPAIQTVFDTFSNFVGSVGGVTIGQRIGEGILQGARFLATIGDSLIANFGNVFSFFSDVGQYWNTVVDFASRVANLFLGAWNVFEAVGNAIGGLFSDIVAALYGVAADLASVVPGFGSFAKELQASADSWAGQADTFAAAMNQNEAEAAAAFGRAFGQSAVQAAPQFTGPLTSALDAAVSQAQQSASAINAAGQKPVVVEVATDAVASAVKGIDSRSKEGVAEMFRIMRGDTGNIQERQLSALETIAENTSDMGEPPDIWAIEGG